jgi:hypothetical protein
MDGCPANMTWARIDDKYDTTNFSYCKFPTTKKILQNINLQSALGGYIGKFLQYNRPRVQKLPKKRNLNMKGHKKMIHAP